MICYPSKHARVFCSGIQAPNAASQEPSRTTLLDHIAHKIAPQESVDFLQHEDIHPQVSHDPLSWLLALLSSTSTRFIQISKSIQSWCLRPRRTAAGGTVVVAQARFRRIPRNGKSSFTTMSLHCHSAVAKKNAALRLKCAARSSTCNGTRRYRKGCKRLQWCMLAEEAFRNARLPVLPGSTPKWDTP